MELYNPSDVAVEATKEITEEDKILYQDQKNHIPDTQSAIVKLVGSEVKNLLPGDSVYIDPNGAIYIDELKLIICHKQNILVVNKGD